MPATGTEFFVGTSGGDLLALGVTGHYLAPALAVERADALLAKNPRNVQLRFLRAVALGDLGLASGAEPAIVAPGLLPAPAPNPC